MNLSKPLSDASLHHQEHNFASLNYRNDRTLKPKPTVGTFQENFSYSSLGRNPLEASAGNAYEQPICGSSFGGSFGHSETDGSFFGGNFRAAVCDDAQVVPDFNDVLETLHVDKTGFSSGPFIAESANYTGVRQLENSDICGPKRRNSERDELEIYFPCVLTPIPVDRLYSTLDGDSTIFKFPGNSDEFLPDDKSRQRSSSEQGDHMNSFSQDTRHSLDSFANLSVFSFPGGNDAQFDISCNQLGQAPEMWHQQRDGSDAWASSSGKGYGSAEGGNGFSDSSRPCIIKQQILPQSTTTLGNSFKFREVLRNSSCPEALSIVAGKNNCETKAFTPRQGSETIYDLPIQLNAAPSYHEFAPNLTVDTDLSLHAFSFDDWRNPCVFDSPAKKPVLEKEEYREGSEASCQRIRAGLVEVAPVGLNFRILSEPESNSKRKRRRVKELPRCSDTGAVKTELATTQESSNAKNSADLNTRTGERMKINRKSRSAGSFYHDNSRGFHNDMEKQRRINMKTRFQNLRMVVPDLLDNEKASKIVILQKAQECIGILEEESVELENVKRTERLRNIELLNKLQKITAGKCE